MRHLLKVLVGLTLLLSPAVTDAQVVVPDRASLEALLTPNAFSENFDDIVLNQQTTVVGGRLDSETILPAFAGAPQQGPGLVPEEVGFEVFIQPGAAFGTLNLNPPGFPTETNQTVTLGSAGGGGGAPPAGIFIDFAVPVTTFGLDLLGPGASFLNGTNTFVVTVLGEDDVTVLATYTLSLAAPIFVGTNEFFGVTGLSGVGGVIIEAQTFVGIDNLVADAAAPSSPSELIEQLIEEVLALNLHAGGESSLLAHLATAARRIGDSTAPNNRAAIESLQSFVNQLLAVPALVDESGQPIPEQKRAELIAAAQELIALLEQ